LAAPDATDRSHERTEREIFSSLSYDGSGHFAPADRLHIIFLANTWKYHSTGAGRWPHESNPLCAMFLEDGYDSCQDAQSCINEFLYATNKFSIIDISTPRYIPVFHETYLKKRNPEERPARSLFSTLLSHSRPCGYSEKMRYEYPGDYCCLPIH